MSNVVIIQNPDPMKSLVEEADWLKRNYPGFEFLKQEIFRYKGYIYDRVNIKTSSGKFETIFFDISKVYAQNGGTRALFGPQGTVARYSPGTFTGRSILQVMRK